MANSRNDMISWKDFQYPREISFYDSLRQIFDDLSKEYKDFAMRTGKHEQSFLGCLSEAVRINGFEGMPALFETISGRLGNEFNPDLFLFQSPVAMATCHLRDPSQRNANGEKLIIMVSQHFLNDLSGDEQASILGHEYGHQLFKHIYIPAKMLLDADLPLSEAKDLKSNVRKWMICTEISCDMVGLISSGCNADAFSSAMLKITTGMNQQCIQDSAYGKNLIKLMLDQFDEITLATDGSIISTHPMTPLRIRIVTEVAKSSQLLKNYGTSANGELRTSWKRELQERIDIEVGKIYPEIIPDNVPCGDFVGKTRRKQLIGEAMMRLGCAVAISDGVITPEEFKAVARIFSSNSIGVIRETMNQFMESIVKEIKGQGGGATDSTESMIWGIVMRLVEESENKAREAEASRADVLMMLRNALDIAAADRRVDECELRTLREFGRRFGFTNSDIYILKMQLGYC